MNADGSAHEVVERFYAAIDADDVEAIVGLCGDDVEVRYPAAGRLPYGGEWHGHEGLVALLEAHEAAEEILEFSVSSMLADAATGTIDPPVAPYSLPRRTANLTRSREPPRATSRAQSRSDAKHVIAVAVSHSETAFHDCVSCPECDSPPLVQDFHFRDEPSHVTCRPD